MEGNLPASGPGRGLYGQRRSRSLDELRRREFARLASLTARERMLEALGLEREFARILPAKKDPSPGNRP